MSRSASPPGLGERRGGPVVGGPIFLTGKRSNRLCVGLLIQYLGAYGLLTWGDLGTRFVVSLGAGIISLKEMIAWLD